MGGSQSAPDRNVISLSLSLCSNFTPLRRIWCRPVTFWVSVPSMPAWWDQNTPGRASFFGLTGQWGVPGECSVVVPRADTEPFLGGGESDLYPGQGDTCSIACSEERVVSLSLSLCPLVSKWPCVSQCCRLLLKSPLSLLLGAEGCRE